MRSEKQQMVRRAGRPPTRQDRVFVLLTSLGFFVLLTPVVCLIQREVLERVVLLAVIGLPVLIINVLFPFSRWGQSAEEAGSHQPDRSSRIEHEGDTSVFGAGRPTAHSRSREMGRRRFKTADGTSFRCEQQAAGLMLNARPLLTVHLLQDGLVRLQTDEQQFLITGASYWEMVFGNEGPTPMQAGLLLARLDELTDLLQAIAGEPANPRAEQVQE